MPVTTTTLGQYLAEKVPARVAYPCFPPLLPTREESVPESDDFFIISEALETTIRNRLGIELGINQSTFICFICRRWKFEGQKKINTYVICTKTATISISAARSIHGLFKDKGLPDVQVELAQEETLKYYNSVACPIPEIYQESYCEIYPQLMEFLTKDPNGVCNAFGLIQRQSCFQTQNLPQKRIPDGNGISKLKTVVLVMIKDGAKYSWTEFEQNLTKILASKGLDFHLSIGLILPYALSDISNSDGPNDIKRIDSLDSEASYERCMFQGHNYPHDPLSGASIGVEGDLKATGTLGINILLRWEDKCKYSALTNFHVVRPIDQDQYRLIYYNGFYDTEPLNQPRNILVQYPSSFDFRGTLKLLENTLTQHQKHLKNVQLIRNNLDHLKERLEKQRKGRGRVFAASGHRATTTHVYPKSKPDPKADLYDEVPDKRNTVCGNVNCTEIHCKMDWALYADTKGDHFFNSPPQHEPGVVWDFNYMPLPSIEKTEEIQPDQWIVKRGRTTGVTTARISSTQFNIHWMSEIDDSGFWTRESLAKGRGFMEKGDSGFAAVNQTGQLVGLGHACIDEGMPSVIAIITPIKVVFADIEKRLRCTVHLLAKTEPESELSGLD